MNRAVKLIASSAPLPSARPRTHATLAHYLPWPRTTDYEWTDDEYAISRFAHGPTHIVGTHLPSGADAAFSLLIKYSLYPRRVSPPRGFYASALIREILFLDFSMHASQCITFCTYGNSGVGIYSFERSHNTPKVSLCYARLSYLWLSTSNVIYLMILYIIYSKLKVERVWQKIAIDQKFY